MKLTAAHTAEREEPDILEPSLRDLSGDEADFRPNATRFNIREVVAHLAKWDAISTE